MDVVAEVVVLDVVVEVVVVSLLLLMWMLKLLVVVVVTNDLSHNLPYELCDFQLSHALALRDLRDPTNVG